MISILLATYNGEKYIKESVDSIINQTFTEWELLVGFNGTTDSSKEIINKYNDSRIRIFDYDNDRGKAKTLNKLIQEAKYEWCAIQDDDDVWNKYKLEYQIKYIDMYDIIGSYIEYINEEGNVIGFPNLSSEHEDIKSRILNADNNIANSSAIFKLNDVLEVNGWDNSLEALEDFDFWIKLIKANKIFFNIPLKLVNHRLHKNSNFNTKKHDINYIMKKNNL